MRLLLCSEVKDKRKKDLMDPLLIMKDCVDRKKVADDKKKDKTVCKLYVPYRETKFAIFVALF